MSNFGKAYLAFTVADGAGHDVRAAYYYNGALGARSGAAERHARRRRRHRRRVRRRSPPPATASRSWPGARAATCTRAACGGRRRAWSTSRPTSRRCRVAARSRRVSRRSRPGATPPTPTSPSRSACRAAASQQTRVLMNRLQGLAVRRRRDGGRALDPGDVERGTDPDVAMTEYGQGFVTSAGQPSNAVVAMELGNNGAPGAVLQINSLPATRAARTRFPGSRACSRPRSPGSRLRGRPGPAEIRVRYEPRASTLGPELVLSHAGLRARPTPRAGSRPPATAAATRRSPGCRAPAPSSEIVVDQLYQPPGRGDRVEDGWPIRGPLSRCSAGRRRAPLGAVHLHGEPRRARRSGRRARRSLRVPAALAQRSPHLVGDREQSGRPDRGSKIARVFVDTVAPVLKVAASGPRRVGSRRGRSRSPTSDPAPASGVAKLTIRWGDGTRDARQARDPPRRPHLPPPGPSTRSRSRSPTAPATRRRWSGA